MNMNTAAPSQKVTAGALAATATTLLVFFLNHYVLKADPIPGEVGAMLAGFAGSLTSYFVRPSDGDVAKIKEG